MITNYENKGGVRRMGRCHTFKRHVVFVPNDGGRPYYTSKSVEGFQDLTDEEWQELRKVIDPKG